LSGKRFRFWGALSGLSLLQQSRKLGRKSGLEFQLVTALGRLREARQQRCKKALTTQRPNWIDLWDNWCQRRGSGTC